MELHLLPFRSEHFAEYAAWFVDPILDRHLGPIGADWLAAVLTESVEEGQTWAVFAEAILVAVIEVAAARPGQSTVLRAIAVHPSRRRQGLGAAAMHAWEEQTGARGTPLDAHVSIDNAAAATFLRALGFEPVDELPVAGYLTFRRPPRKLIQ